MRARVYVGAAVIGLSLLLLGVTWLEDGQKKSRIAWLEKAEGGGDLELTRQLLGALVRDYPNDPVVEAHWRAHQAMAEARAIEEQRFRARVDEQGQVLSDLQERFGITERTQKTIQARTETVQKNLHSFQSEFQSQFGTLQSDFGSFRTGFDEFSVQVDESFAAVAAKEDPQPEEDYLYLLLKESRNPAPQGAAQVKVLVNQALVAATQKQWAQTRTLCREALRSEPQNLQAAALWIFASVRQSPESLENLGRLLPVAEALIEKQPDNFWVLMSAATLYRAKGGWTLAEERFHRASEADPESREAREGWLTCLVSLGRVSEAQALAWSLWDSGPKDDEAALSVWGALGQSSDEQKRALFAQWRGARPDSALVDLYEGDHEVLLGRLAPAIDLYVASWKKKPTKPALQRLAETRWKAQQYREAAQDLRILLRMTNPGMEAGREEFAAVGLTLVRADAEAKAWSDVIADGGDVLRVISDLLEVRALVGRAYLTVGDWAKAAEVLEPFSVRVGAVGPLDDLLQAYWQMRKFEVIQKKVDALVNQADLGADVRTLLSEWKARLATLEKKS